MKLFLWIIIVLIAICSVHITTANLQRPNSTAEYIPAPTLFRSVFAGRPAPGYPKDPAVPAKKEEDESEEDNLLDDAVEENKVNTENGSEESDEDDHSNESRIKKSASSDESGSDEDESDEEESDEDESDEEDDDKPKRKPSRWRQTRYGSSFRIQTVGRPINYGHHHDSRKPETPRY